MDSHQHIDSGVGSQTLKGIDYPYPTMPRKGSTWTPERREAFSQRITRKWQDPEYRAKRQRLRESRPKVIRPAWTPEQRAAHSQIMLTPEMREATSQRMKELWATPEYRANRPKPKPKPPKKIRVKKPKPPKKIRVKKPKPPKKIRVKKPKPPRAPRAPDTHPTKARPKHEVCMIRNKGPRGPLTLCSDLGCFDDCVDYTLALLE
ncbi:unnamed protein product [marine sediment metagenome]|uniref:Nuclease associated modular domain-containing protein n=1 Tax=marine sediment metagenome TaxID=412755 RepID=X1D8W3_9ZZZZ